MNCSVVGDANPDIAGIGIVLSFTIQAFLAIAVSFYSYVLDWKKDLARIKPSRDNLSELQPWQMRQRIANKILVKGSDVQSINGIALLVTALVQIDTLPFYHLRIVFDTASLVAVSTAAAVICSFDSTVKHKSQRYGLIFIWAIIYLAYSSIFAKRLLSWNYNSPGHCYNGSALLFPSQNRIWIAGWTSYVLFSLSLAIGLGRDFIFSRRTSFSIAAGLLFVAAFQSPFHTYSIFTLRKDNEAFLTSGITEHQWGFGQTVAMILLGTNVIVLVNGIQDYREWKIEVARRRAEVPIRSSWGRVQIIAAQEV